MADCVISTNRITRSGTQRVLLSCRFGATRYKQKHAPRAEQGVQEKGRETGGDSTRGSLSSFDAEHEKRGGVSKFLLPGHRRSHLRSRHFVFSRVSIGRERECFVVEFIYLSPSDVNNSFNWNSTCFLCIFCSNYISLPRASLIHRKRFYI